MSEWSAAEGRGPRNPEFKDSHCSGGINSTTRTDPDGGLLNAEKSRFEDDAG